MRLLVAGLLLAALVFGQAGESVAGQLVSGKLKETAAGPVLVTAQGEVAVTGDEESNEVLRDQRLEGLQLEGKGHFTDATHFRLDHFHTKPLRVVQQDGVKKEVTYWCEVCSIRTYTPGKCLCCQEETALDLRVVE